MSNHANQTPPILLTIAGFDPSCGAGVAADLKTFAAHNCYGVAAITALTVQSTQGVRAVHATPERSCARNSTRSPRTCAIAGVKIGMLANRGERRRRSTNFSTRTNSRTWFSIRFRAHRRASRTARYGGAEIRARRAIEARQRDHAQHAGSGIPDRPGSERLEGHEDRRQKLSGDGRACRGRHRRASRQAHRRAFAKRAPRKSRRSAATT